MLTVIYKPTTECNLSCKYCYVGLRHPAKGIIDPSHSIDIFEAIIKSMVSRNPKKNCIIIHGGEPLLLGLDFFRECQRIVVRYEEKYGLSIKKSIQSNLILLDEEMLLELQSDGYEISTSLDGSRFAHDFFRMDKNKKTTFDAVLSKIDMAKRLNVKINVVCCLSSFNIAHPIEVYDFFNENGINPKFNYIDSETDALPVEAVITPTEYADFLIKITDKWISDAASGIEIMPSSDMISAVINGASESCVHSSNCLDHFIGVGPQGEIFPCGKFVGLEKFALGSVFELPNAITDCNFRNIDLSKLPLECSTCEHGFLCNGMCPFDRYIDNRCFDKLSRWCSAYKSLWYNMKKIVERYRLTDYAAPK